jgi:hypothetical protein
VVTALDRARDTLRTGMLRNPGARGRAVRGDLVRHLGGDAARGSTSSSGPKGQPRTRAHGARRGRDRGARRVLPRPRRPRVAAHLRHPRSRTSGRSFYHDHWVQQQRDRAPALAAGRGGVAGPPTTRSCSDSSRTRSSRGGEIILSLPLDGGGAHGERVGPREHDGDSYPERAADAPEVAYMVAHEGDRAAGQRRDRRQHHAHAESARGYGDRLASPAAVLGGLLVIERTLPELADGYARCYYCAQRVARTAAPTRARRSRRRSRCRGTSATRSGGSSTSSSGGSEAVRARRARGEPRGCARTAGASPAARTVVGERMPADDESASRLPAPLGPLRARTVLARAAELQERGATAATAP